MYTYLETISTIIICNWINISKNIMRYRLQELKMCQTFGAEITSGISNNKLNCGWMIPRSTKSLSGGELYQAGDLSKVCTYWGFPTPAPPWKFGITTCQIYIYKERTKGDELNQEIFCESDFLDVMMWSFVDVKRLFVIKVL